jgi:VCBS repeat-containing protein
LGSGGGVGCCGGRPIGGNGGGRIQISAGSLRVDGQIVSDGGSGSDPGGGGSGGSINLVLTGGTFSGNGVIRAEGGGSGRFAVTAVGGGGRLAICGFDQNTYSGTTAAGTVVIQSRPALSIDDVPVTEPLAGTTDADFMVSLSVATCQPVTVRIDTTNDSAVAPDDFVSAGNTLTFNPGETMKNVAIAVKSDSDAEPTERFFVNLSSPTGASIARSQGSGTITNNGGAATNTAPRIDDQQFPVAENSPNGTIVGNVAASDTDAGQTLSFAITAGNTSGAFAIDAGSGQITVINGAALEFETTPMFNLTVQVTDSGIPTLSDTATVTINVTDVNEPPVISNQGFAVAENSPNGIVVGTVVASDPDAAQTLNFAITAGNTSGAFAIDTLTGQLTVANSAVLGFEMTPTFQLTVQVTDDGNPMLSDAGTITIDLIDVNEQPVGGCQQQARQALAQAAGNVRAWVVSGRLFVRGDSASNDITIESGASVNSVRVGGGEGTRVGSRQAQEFTGITRGIEVRTVGGTDSVAVVDAVLSGDVTIRFGALADHFTACNATFNGSVKSRGGRGPDAVTVDDSVFNGPLSVPTGRKNDTVRIEQAGDPAGPPTIFRGPVQFRLLGANDSFQAGLAGELGNSAHFMDEVLIDGGLGLDILDAGTGGRPNAKGNMFAAVPQILGIDRLMS